ncbi:unnamed protein product [Kuraishia capsulata CBS 1993]|uniref:J domain-containing protein n=1 Tax=Kuraishia capsulata CBS 1993 TaxID=1382522 RepID=W6MKN8_9ASCO|nr:uncharacterized protein KUCA_T00002550001 [Kuraishia capsulata CBS 1993]CDK26578.1 unnamed protein product [Kuraishia capsulata CBS 1993]
MLVLHSSCGKCCFGLIGPQIARFSTTTQRLSPLGRSNAKVNHYDVLGLPLSATEKEIKRKFRELSKQYHPDLQNSRDLTASEKEENKEKFVQIVDSYEVLSDKIAKKEFDTKFKTEDMVAQDMQQRRARFNEQYFGSSTTYTNRPSGLNTSRNRVYYGEGVKYRGKSYFGGHHKNTSNYDVPHFDYDWHLAKNIKADRRLQLSKAYNGGDLREHHQVTRSIKNGIKRDLSDSGPPTRAEAYPGNRNEDIPSGSKIIYLVLGVGMFVGSASVLSRPSQKEVPKMIKTSYTPPPVVAPKGEAQQNRAFEDRSQKSASSKSSDISTLLLRSATRGTSRSQDSLHQD